MAKTGRPRKSGALLRGRERSRRIADLVAQQRATAEVLRVMSSSVADPKPVFDAMLEGCQRLFEGRMVGINLVGDDGKIHLGAYQGRNKAELQKHFPVPLSMESGTGAAILRRAVLHYPDVEGGKDVPEYARRGARINGIKSTLFAPMLWEDRAIGAIFVGRQFVGPFSEQEIGLLKTFADQAAIAIQSARLFNEIQEKSRELELANTFKSRFLSAASHDLRQPLHALNLFAAQLHGAIDSAERERLTGRIDAALRAMNELFNVLLDVSKLDAGVLEAKLSEFPAAELLKRLETTFADAAREKGLRLRVVPSRAWVRSDFILLERIVGNLVSNAVRYTARGGVVLGCRRRGKRLRLEVWDSGPGIPQDQRRNVFREFYQLGAPGPDHAGGLGLGLAIVERLGRLLGHPVELSSRLGRGSTFSISVPLAAGRRGRAKPARAATASGDLGGRLIVVIDDDPLVLQAMQGILRSWGCRVTTAQSHAAALAQLEQVKQRPDLIICDYRLAEGRSGIREIENLRGALGNAVPAFLISGDTAPERLREAAASNFHLLHKPVPAMMLRAMVARLLKNRPAIPRPA
jgi:signal transduction histidine kinase/CheY-like chemotaxis protein